ncbi:MAG: hypothetical protein ACLFTR_05000 [Candidatus Woesearchaeota archaeon]
MDEMNDIKKELKEIEDEKKGMDKLLDGLNTEKIQNIQQVIDEINELIKEREKLSSKLINSYESLLSKINSIIGRVPQDNLKEEIVLHEKVVNVEEAKIREHLDCWRDIALLKRELREVLREFREQESMQNTYADLLSGENE